MLLVLHQQKMINELIARVSKYNCTFYYNKMEHIRNWCAPHDRYLQNFNIIPWHVTIAVRTNLLTSF